MPATPDPARLGTPRIGRVLRFEAERGLGVLAEAGGTELPFHCTAIADGSRMIEEGTRVAYVVVPGRLGRLEARGLTPL